MSDICTVCGEVIDFSEVMIVFEGLMYHRSCYDGEDNELQE